MMRSFQKTRSSLLFHHRAEGPLPPKRWVERGYNIQHWTEMPWGPFRCARRAGNCWWRISACLSEIEDTGRRIGLHAFRHTLISILLDVAAPTVAQRQLRHSSASTTLGIYGHVIGDSHRHVMERASGTVPIQDASKAL